MHRLATTLASPQQRSLGLGRADTEPGPCLCPRHYGRASAGLDGKPAEWASRKKAMRCPCCRPTKLVHPGNGTALGWLADVRAWPQTDPRLPRNNGPTTAKRPEATPRKMNQERRYQCRHLGDARQASVRSERSFRARVRSRATSLGNAAD